jgi:hypothetical protein
MFLLQNSSLSTELRYQIPWLLSVIKYAKTTSNLFNKNIT